MFLSAETEDDIELTELGYNQPARLSRELHGHHKSLSNADQVTRHDLSRRHHSNQTGLVDPHSDEYYDTVSLRLSQLRHDDEASIPARETPPARQHASNDINNSCIDFDPPSAPSSKDNEITIQSSRTACNQLSHTLNHPQFLAGEIVPHTGKGKGRIPIVEQESRDEQKPAVDPEPSAVQKSSAEQEFVVEQEHIIDGPGHPQNLLQHPRLDRPPISSSHHGKDTQLERRQYQPKEFQYLQGKEGYICTAVRSDKCKVHGKLLQKGAAVQHQGGSASRELGRGASTNWFIVDESAKGCVAPDDHDLTSLAEQAGQAAERRKEDWSSVGPCEGLMFLLIFTLAIVAVACGKHLA